MASQSKQESIKRSTVREELEASSEMTLQKEGIKTTQNVRGKIRTLNRELLELVLAVDILDLGNGGIKGKEGWSASSQKVRETGKVDSVRRHQG